MSGPKWALLAWPALFLSLGYNFWDYGLDAPGEQGANAGWIVCGVLFVLMGGLPLLALKSRTLRKATFWSDGSGSHGDPLAIRPTARTVVRAAKPMFRGRSAPPPYVPPAYAPPPSSPPPFTAPSAPPTPHFSDGVDATTQMVGELQRLAEMHRAGELTDE